MSGGIVTQKDVELGINEEVKLIVQAAALFYAHGMGSLEKSVSVAYDLLAVTLKTSEAFSSERILTEIRRRRGY